MTLTTKTVLDNGLTVILKEMHHAPVTSFMIWYRVGSRNEIPGITGISHWVEHMMFRGTPKFPGGVLDRLVSREGGHWNAFTWIDFTAYYETMPSGRIDLALDLEADRMVNLLLAEADVEAERGVILSERAMYENSPQFLLDEEVSAAVFRVHPYHHEIIGDVPDLQTMTRTDLHNYYRRYYAPNNAIVVAVGDFDTAVMLQNIRQKFEAIPAGEVPTAVTRQEPRQLGERRVIVNGPADAAQLNFTYRAPAASHPDYFALTLLNAAFAGGSSLGMFGGGGSNKSSRLYKALVDTDLAVSAYGGLGPSIDPFLYSINVTVRDGRSLHEVEDALEVELARLRREPITERELAKAMKRAKVEFVTAGESITGQAQLLGMSEAVVGDYGWYETVLAQLSQVTLDDLARVCETYLHKRNRTVGWYEPDEDDEEE
jgi:zinc protease